MGVDRNFNGLEIENFSVKLGIQISRSVTYSKKGKKGLLSFSYQSAPRCKDVISMTMFKGHLIQCHKCFFPLSMSKQLRCMQRSFFVIFTTQVTTDYFCLSIFLRRFK